MEGGRIRRRHRPALRIGVGRRRIAIRSAATLRCTQRAQQSKQHGYQEFRRWNHGRIEEKTALFVDQESVSIKVGFGCGRKTKKEVVVRAPGLTEIARASFTLLLAQYIFISSLRRSFNA